MGQRDAERVIDLGDASEGRIETLGVHLAHDLEPDLARHAPMKLATSELALCLVADMDRKGRCGSVEELRGMRQHRSARSRLTSSPFLPTDRLSTLWRYILGV